MCCSVLQSVAECCSAFQCVAAYCSIHLAVHQYCNTLVFLACCSIHLAQLCVYAYIVSCMCMCVCTFVTKTNLKDWRDPPSLPTLLPHAYLHGSGSSRCTGHVIVCVLQFSAVCRSVLQCVALWYLRGAESGRRRGNAAPYTLQCVAVSCIVLQRVCVAVCRSVFQK